KQKYHQIDDLIQKLIVQQNILISQQTLSLLSFTTNLCKHLCCTTTELKKTILAQLFELGNTVFKNKIQKVLLELLIVSPD
ncbi:16813_t:CDS:1, partial [Cetraspora pellucida]